MPKVIKIDLEFWPTIREIICGSFSPYGI